MHIHLSVCTHIHTPNKHIHVHSYTYIQCITHAHTHTRTRTYTFRCVHTHLLSHKYTCTHTLTHSHTHTQVHTKLIKQLMCSQTHRYTQVVHTRHTKQPNMCDINLYSQQTIDIHENVFCRPNSVYHNLEQLLQRGGGGGADGYSQ